MDDKVNELRGFLDNLQLDQSRSRSWQRWAAYFAVLLSLILSWYVSELYSQNRITTEFQAQCNRIQFRISTRVKDYTQMNRSMVAFFESSREVTEEEFSHYVSMLEAAKHFPGVTACSASYVVEADEVEEFEKRRDIRIYPLSDTDTKVVVTYIEPIGGNEAATGLDTWSREPLRGVLLKAAASGEASISEAIRLVQETQDNMLAFLCYLPKYKPNAVGKNIEDVEVYLAIVVRAPDFAKTLFGEDKDFRFELYDGEATSEDAVMYRDPELDGYGYKLRERRTIDVAQHKWTFVVEKQVQYGDDFHNVGNIIVFLLGCMFVTWLFMLR